jgi:hypothetical protein
LTSGIEIDSEVYINEREIDESLSQFLNNQRKELKKSKEMLSQTNNSSKSYSQKNSSHKKMEFVDFPERFDEFEALTRKNTGSPRRHYSRHIQ